MPAVSHTPVFPFKPPSYLLRSHTLGEHWAMPETLPALLLALAPIGAGEACGVHPCSVCGAHTFFKDELAGAQQESAKPALQAHPGTFSHVFAGNRKPKGTASGCPPCPTVPTTWTPCHAPPPSTGTAWAGTRRGPSPSGEPTQLLSGFQHILSPSQKAPLL